MSHTKGPWIFTPGNMPAIADSTCAPVAMQCRRGTPEEAKANAQLIAAAPELLEALERLLLRCEEILPSYDAKDVIEPARAAIAKAKGE